MFFVYILYSKTCDRYYTGYTDNLERRLDEHNTGRSRFIKHGIPWTLVHTETYGHDRVQ